MIEYAANGLYLDQVTSPNISGNSIRHNENGIQAHNYFGNRPTPAVHGNSFTDNGQHFFVSTSFGWGDHVLDATGNWWGVQNELDIAALIYDHDEDAGLATVDFSGWLYHVADNQGPVVGDILFDEQPVADGDILDHPGLFSVTATDMVSGIERVDFIVNGDLAHTVTAVTGPYRFDWNAVAVGDGVYEMVVRAYDTLGNVSERRRNFTLALAPPAVPQILAPVDGLLVSRQVIMVEGQADRYSQITIYANGSPAATVAVDDEGTFRAGIPLVEGGNRIEAMASHRGGASAVTPAVEVVMDPMALGPPVDLSALARPGGQVRLAWQEPLGEIPAGYRVYRSEHPFTDPLQAQLITPEMVVARTLTDTPPTEARYYYRVSAVDAVGNESVPGPQATAVSDATLPAADRLTLTSTGPHDAAVNSYGPGEVTVEVMLSEPVTAPPQLALLLEGGGSLPVSLEALNDTRYQGRFSITGDTANGRAVFSFAGYDAAGNTGHGIGSGGEFVIDTRGPNVTAFSITPGPPLVNDPAVPLSVQVSLTLDEDTVADQPPSLDVRWQGATAPVPVTPVLSAGDRMWRAEVTVPPEAGGTPGDTLLFGLSATDVLGNTNTIIGPPHAFEIYQGALPPLSPPQVQGQSLAAGGMRLDWEEVAGAAGYRVYRQGPGDTSMTLVADLDAMTLFFEETPGPDGEYLYAVATVRTANGEIAEGEASPPVPVIVDATPPAVPEGFALVLTAAGVQASWQAVTSEPLRYRLYRSTGGTGGLAGLVPIAEGGEDGTLLDRNPSLTEQSYAITAVDAAGNESLPTAFAALNFDLLPVKTLTVTLRDGEFPVLSWAAGGPTTAAYHVAVIEQGEERIINNGGLATTLVDTGYTGGERTYQVTVEDNNGSLSLPRRITLPELAAGLGETVLRRGAVKRLLFALENRSQDAYSLSVDISGPELAGESGSVVLGPGEGNEVAVPVVAGGRLGETASFEAAFVAEAGPGLRAEIIHSFALPVEDRQLPVSILSGDFVRGETAHVRFQLTNTMDAALQLLTAGSGGAASPEVVLNLVDGNGFVLATQALAQTTGEGIGEVNGFFAATVPPGGTFISAPMDLPVPLTAPADLSFQLRIGSLHYLFGEAGAMDLPGVTAGYQVHITDTDYFAEVTAVTPAASRGNEPIAISGRAVSREHGTELGGALVKIGIANHGFVSWHQAVTDENGRFVYTHLPLAGEAGRFSVWALHPDLDFQNEQASFVIRKIYAPSTLSVQAIPDIAATFVVDLRGGEGTGASNLRLEADSLPAGVHLTLPSGQDLAPGGSLGLACLVTIDSGAGVPAEVRVPLRLVSDDAADPWGVVELDLSTVSGRPFIVADPGYLETGMADGENSNASIMLRNTGTASLNGATLSLINPATGTPAPSWVRLAVGADLPEMGVGDQLPVTLAFSPQGIAQGTYEYALRVRTADEILTDIPLYVAISAAETGGVNFHVADIYTDTPAADGTLIPGMEGARIRLQNTTVPTLIRELVTGADGTALFDALPVGRYVYRVTAPARNTATGTVRVFPATVTPEEVFLDADLVTVEWEVTPVTIEDRYEITLKATFETDVPAPVVVADPASISLPDMAPGDVIYGEFTLTNHGFVRADDLRIELPRSDEYLYEVPGGLPTSLDAKASVVVPYRVTRKSLVQVVTQGAAGGCVAQCVDIPYGYVCANGTESGGTALVCFTPGAGECGGGPVTVSGGGGGGGGGRVSPAEITVNGSEECVPEKDPDECMPKRKTGSGVGYVYGVYSDTVRDLEVKVNGGMAVAGRKYDDGQWYFGMDKDRVVMGLFDKTGSISSDRISTKGRLALHKGPALYHYAGELGPDQYNTETRVQCSDFEDFCTGPRNVMFRRGDNTIRTLGGYGTFLRTVPLEFQIFQVQGYLWERPDGTWLRYDERGRVVARGYGEMTFLAYSYAADDTIREIRDSTGDMVLTYTSDNNGLITGVTDRAGRHVSYQYTDGRLTAVTDVLGHVMTYEYDAAGKMIRKTDPMGHSQYIDYDAAGYVKSVVDDAGRGTFFTYKDLKAEGLRYSRVSTSGGLVKELWFDLDHDLRKVVVNDRLVFEMLKDIDATRYVDANGNVTIKRHNDFGMTTEIVHPDGAVRRFVYDASGRRLVREIDEEGAVTAFEYDARGLLAAVTKAQGTAAAQRLEMRHDGMGNLVELTKVWTDSRQVEHRESTTFTYDAFGNRLTKTDPMGNTTRYEYNVSGRLTKVTDPENRVWTSAYDNAGHRLSNTSPLGETVAYEYDANGNLTARIYPDPAIPTGARYEFEYDAHNRRVLTRNPEGGEWRVEYNDDSLPVSEIDPEGGVKRLEYDLSGRLVAEIDPAGNRTTYEYGGSELGDCESCALDERRGLVTAVNFPTYRLEMEYDSRGNLAARKTVSDGGAALTAFDRDGVGRVLKMTDPLGHATTYAYNPLGRLVSVADALNGETLYSFDAGGAMDGITDPAGGVTAFTYNANAAMLSLLRPSGAARRWEYDASGAPLRKVLPSGRSIGYHYNGNRILDGIDYLDPSGQVAASVGFTYNPAAMITGYDDGRTVARYSYTPGLHKDGEEVDYGVFSASFRYLFDRAGRKTGLEVTDGGGRVFSIAFHYDKAGNLLEVNLPESLAPSAAGASVRYGDFLWQRPRTVVFPGGIREARSYDGRGRLVAMDLLPSGGGMMLDAGFSYDAEGKLIAGTIDGAATTYGYDSLHRLTGISGSGVATSWQYDAMGNRLTEDEGEAWQYDVDNALLSGGGFSFTYDEDGNQTSRTNDATGDTWTYGYDAAGRLATVAQGGNVVARYLYDPFGRRLQKDTGGTVTNYLYNDEGLLAEMDAGGNITVLYVFAPGSGWTRAPVAMVTAAGSFFYHNDSRGAPLAMTAHTGELVWQAATAPFGDQAPVLEKVVSNLRFPGQYYDAESGLHYNYQRYYDPATGRYLRFDPIDLKGGLNLYLYAGADPLNNIDERGESLCGGADVFLGLGGGGVAVCAGICCQNEAKFAYTKSSVKMGAGFGLGADVGGTMALGATDIKGNCPKVACRLEDAVTLGPFGFSLDHQGNTGVAVNSGLGLNLGVFLVCDFPELKYIGCCE